MLRSVHMISSAMQAGHLEDGGNARVGQRERDEDRNDLVVRKRTREQGVGPLAIKCTVGVGARDKQARVSKSQIALAHPRTRTHFHRPGLLICRFMFR